MTFAKAAAGLLCATLTASAAAPLFDFEGPDAAAALPYRNRAKTALDIVPAFATSGTNSLRFSSAEWQPGMPEWPAFELKTPLRDWRGYDRLVVDITNPSETRFPFSLFVSDSKVPIRQGLRHSFAVPAPASPGASCRSAPSQTMSTAPTSPRSTSLPRALRPIWRCISTP